MASIRRTLSPYSDRSHSNGLNNDPFSLQSIKQPPLFNGGRTTSLSPVRRFLTGFFLQKQHQNYSRKTSNYFSLRKPLFRCFIFFFLGFLFGTAPFNTDLKISDFSFEMRPPPPPVVVVNNVDVVKRSVVDDVDVVRSKENAADVAMNTVELAAVVQRSDSSVVPMKQLLVVTPTYNRATQAYYLNRLGQVLRLVKPPVVWIVVEMNAASMETAEILRNMGIMYRHLVCARNSTDVKDRGVHQRNTALEHIERHRLDGIVYFADDDNIYSRELFEGLRDISRFGTWPVAMLAQSKSKAILEGPVCNGSEVIGWHTNDKSKRLRRFHVDMSGFAFNSTILWDPKKWHRPTSDPIRQLDTVKEGFQETTFIEQIVEDESQMEGLPLDCSRIMNWHLHLEARDLLYPKGWILQKNLDGVIPLK